MKVIKPKCPQCGKVFLGSLEGKITHVCKGCGLVFELDTNLTNE